MEKLFDDAEIVCLQETWLAKQDLGGLNSINPNFHGIGESTTDLKDRTQCGRIPGGVAILWNTKYEHIIREIRLDVNWAIGISVNIDEREFVIINVYMPFQANVNEVEYLDRLAYLKAFIDDLPTSSVYVVGDLNANISDSRSLFGNHLQQFCRDSELNLSSKMILPEDSFTYVCTYQSGHGLETTTSWLDHCISSADAHQSIDSIKILYNYATSDHMPFTISLKLDNIPALTQTTNDINKGKLDWANKTIEEVSNYRDTTQVLLNRIELPQDAILCKNVNCNHESHKNDLSYMYNQIVDSLHTASEPLYKFRNRVRNIRPGWNEHVAELHTAARDAFKLWVDTGKSRQGQIFQWKQRSHLRFKYALRFIKNNENTMRADSLARKLQNRGHKDFWKEVKSMSNSKTPLPTNIEGISGEERIVELWRKHYSDLFNCLRSGVCNIGGVEFNEGIVVRINEMEEAINKLENNKSSGLDSISAEHLKNASKKLVPLLSMCITGFLIHGFIPDSMIAVLLVPVIKDKTGKITSKDNYRPIALASVMSKVLEMILLARLEVFLLTKDNQFGFKKKHGTDMCIFALKEIVGKYRSLNSTMFLCFLDASKAFDRVNHVTLFRKLQEGGVPPYLVRILAFWYAHQAVKVRWGDAISTQFHVSNGVRQGGILSPFLFNLYMDGLSTQLNECKTGCMVGTKLVNHLMYADDLVIFCPYSGRMQKLLQICSVYGVENDIKYNAKKSNMMIARCRDDRDTNFPEFILSGEALKVCSETKYLGHYITDEMTDDSDTLRQRRTLYGQGNTLKRKFHMCSNSVKASLFRAFCTPLYTAHLWRKFKNSDSIEKIRVAYNDALRMLLGIRRWNVDLNRPNSASKMFEDNNVPTFEEVIINLTAKFKVRLDKSENSIIKMLVDPNCSSIRFSSQLRKYWFYLHRTTRTNP